MRVGQQEIFKIYTNYTRVSRNCRVDEGEEMEVHPGGVKMYGWATCVYVIIFTTVTDIGIR